MKTKAIVGVICLIAGVVLGSFLGSRIEREGNEERTAAAVEEESARAGRLEVEVSRLQMRVDLLGMHLRLGRIAMEADRQDYGTAGERATHFFDDVALMAEQAEDGGKTDAVLQHVLAARDELIAGLATAQPSAAERLKQLYLELFAMGVDPNWTLDEFPEKYDNI